MEHEMTGTRANHLSQRNGELTQPDLVEHLGLNNFPRGQTHSVDLLLLTLCHLYFLNSQFFCLFLWRLSAMKIMRGGAPNHEGCPRSEIYIK